LAETIRIKKTFGRNKGIAMHTKTTKASFGAKSARACGELNTDSFYTREQNGLALSGKYLRRPDDSSG
jgi:hypothetical protein